MTLDNIFFFSNEIFRWIILPFFVFFARVCDVSLGTIRIISIARGKKYLAPILGFFELLIWLLAIGQIMQNLDNIMLYLAYAGGFAIGTFVGIYLEEKLAENIILIRIITQKDATELINFMHSKNYGVTSVDAHGATGQVHIIFTIVPRVDVNEVSAIIQKYNPKAFYTIEDIRYVHKGIFPHNKSSIKNRYLKLLKNFRKGK